MRRPGQNFFLMFFEVFRQPQERQTKPHYEHEGEKSSVATCVGRKDTRTIQFLQNVSGTEIRTNSNNFLLSALVQLFDEKLNSLAMIGCATVGREAKR
jgi:hypothetical protein